MLASTAVTLVTFHVIPHGDGSFTHFDRSVDEGLYDALAHHYVVALADNAGLHRRVRAFFYAKTSCHHTDPGFATAMLGAAAIIPSVAEGFSSTMSLLPSRIDIAPTTRLSEQEMLVIAMNQQLKLDAHGCA